MHERIEDHETAYVYFSVRLITPEQNRAILTSQSPPSFLQSTQSVQPSLLLPRATVISSPIATPDGPRGLPEPGRGFPLRADPSARPPFVSPSGSCPRLALPHSPPLPEGSQAGACAARDLGLAKRSLHVRQASAAEPIAGPDSWCPSPVPSRPFPSPPLPAPLAHLANAAASAAEHPHCLCSNDASSLARAEWRARGWLCYVLNGPRWREGSMRASCTRVTIGQAPPGVTGAGGGWLFVSDGRDAGQVLEGANRTEEAPKAARLAGKYLRA